MSDYLPIVAAIARIFRTARLTADIQPAPPPGTDATGRGMSMKLAQDGWVPQLLVDLELGGLDPDDPRPIEAIDRGLLLGAARLFRIPQADWRYSVDDRAWTLSFDPRPDHEIGGWILARPVSGGHGPARARHAAAMMPHYRLTKKGWKQVDAVVKPKGKNASPLPRKRTPKLELTQAEKDATDAYHVCRSFAAAGRKLGKTRQAVAAAYKRAAAKMKTEGVHIRSVSARRGLPNDRRGNATATGRRRDSD